MQNHIDELAATIGFQKWSQRDQLVESGTQTVEIAAPIRPTFESFGRHVAERADEVARVSETFSAFCFREAEIGHPDVAAGIEQQVRWLDVAMQDAFGVGIRQCFGNLQSDAGHAAIKLAATVARRKL